MSPRKVSPFRALGRGVLRRCPRCGQGGLFTRWFAMPDRCPRCGLAFERGDGFWLGAMAINLGVAEGAFGVYLVAVIAITWPTVPWFWLTVGGLLLGVVAPIVFYPFSKTIFLAIDLWMHNIDNPEAHELEALPPQVSGGRKER